MRRICGCVLALLALSVCQAARADVRLPRMFSDHAVFQRDLPLVVWGWADPAEKIKVDLGKDTMSTVAGTNGSWSVTLSPLKAGGPIDMVVSGKNTNTVKDILVGDVWICSGQSNMEFPLSGADNAGDAVKAATNSKIRLLHVTADQLAEPANDIPNTWSVCSPESAAGFSAVGYFFGKAVQEETGIPIGLIESAWGGTAIEPWTSPGAWAGIEELAKLKTDPNSLGHIYNGRIAPLAPYGIKGALWYQGESNGGDDDIYFHKMRALISCWRQTWHVYSGKKKARNGGLPGYEFPFYFVQLANFQASHDNPQGGDGWAKIRMAQFKALTIPHTGMAVAMDLADVRDPGDIHPKNKRDVGERLALWALAKDYGKKEAHPTNA